ncbi:hypothetical protein [Metabacillus arenae]|uniref:hypothetical protein n=1 Tax=Metabacillus arenae TaxID=2771434 RepID=UPI0037C58F61
MVKERINKKWYKQLSLLLIFFSIIVSISLLVNQLNKPNEKAYAHNTSTLKEDFNGMDSIVRQIELKHEGNIGYYLASQPIEALNSLATSTDSLKDLEVNGSETLLIKGDVYQLEADISWTESKKCRVEAKRID